MNNNYYDENKIADLVVRTMYELTKNSMYIDFEKFICKLKKKNIIWDGEHFQEVMFEVANRYVLRESFKQYLKNHLQ